MSKNQCSFYIVIIVTTLLDLALITGIIWRTLSITGNAFILGVILSLSTLIPFFIRKLLVDHLGLLKQINIKPILWLKICAYLLVFLAVLYFQATPLILIFTITLLYGVINFLIMSILEAYNVYYVLHKMITSEKAARFMQTAIQVGAFSGSLAGGYLVGALSFTNFLKVLLAAQIMSSLLFFMFKPPDGNTIQNIHTSQHGDEERYNIDFLAILLCITLGIVGFHIGAFNIVIPVVYQNIYQWHASYLGLTSGFAGIGAFVATLLSNKRRVAGYVCLAIAVCDFLLVFMDNKLVAVISGLVIGFSMNYSRIALKQQIITISVTKTIADKLASLSTLYYLLLQASAPLIVSGILIVSSNSYAPVVFVVIGLLLSLSLLYSFVKSENVEKRH